MVSFTLNDKRVSVDAEPGTPAQLAAYVKAEIQRFDKLIKAIGLTLE